VLADIPKDYGAFMFRVRQSKKTLLALLSLAYEGAIFL
jgi:hypothetical protein